MENHCILNSCGKASLKKVEKVFVAPSTLVKFVIVTLIERIFPDAILKKSNVYLRSLF